MGIELQFYEVGRLVAAQQSSGFVRLYKGHLEWPLLFADCVVIAPSVSIGFHAQAGGSRQGWTPEFVEGQRSRISRQQTNESGEREAKLIFIS